MRYHIKKSEKKVSVEDRSAGYSLDLTADKDLGDVHFINWEKIDPRLPECGHPITGRSLDKYAEHFPKLTIDPKLQYLEVGAGLGALIPSLVSGFDGKLKAPIIIDPANYQVMKEMLEHALRKKLTNKKQKELSEQFLRRIELITNPDKVRLYNTTLGRALEENPELKGCADAVIDLAGPKVYSETEIKEEDRFGSGRELKQILELRIRLLELQLLKPTKKKGLFA